jgi:hypothetical protein
MKINITWVVSPCLLPAHPLAHALPNPTSTEDIHQGSHHLLLVCFALHPPAPCYELRHCQLDLVSEPPSASSSPTRHLLLIASKPDLKPSKAVPEPPPSDYLPPAPLLSFCRRLILDFKVRIRLNLPMRSTV